MEQNKAKKMWLEKQDEIHNNVVKTGLKAALLYGSGGLLAHSLLTWKVDRYRKHTLPFKVFILLVIPTAAFFTKTDVAAMEADREFASQFSVSTKEDLQIPAKEFQFTSMGVKEYLKDNQYAILGYSWLSLMLGSLIYNFANPEIKMQQKFINARMVSQTGALIGIVGVAAFSAKKEGEREISKNDPHFDRIVRK